ncbi:RNA polymerase sigma factor [Streptomyces cacaoi]|uniref:RNA polymerase sigma factor n=1 Tax=Streptomyces cacaoi TaxID=1898 RepID=UPI00374802F3
MADAEPQPRRMLLYKFGISHHNAEDVLAGVRERWLRSLQQGSDMPQHPRGYLFALTRNGAVDHLRKASSRHEVPTSDADWNALESMLDQVRSAEDVVTASLLNEQLLAKVRSLPHVQRRVIECLFLKDMTPGETAQRLAISVDSVMRSRLRALKTLRNMYVHAALETADGF